MDLSWWKQIEDLYQAALERESAERAALLAQADSKLRQEVESLLAREPDGALLDRPAWVAAPSLIESGLAPGTRLGPYEILAPIGAGGMGYTNKWNSTLPPTPFLGSG